ncbi:MAG: hypothetical protein IPL88_06185 [Rhizobiales bacterium]|nr:hypothetical protein [Hyphomicrobiales bacterium]
MAVADAFFSRIHLNHAQADAALEARAAQGPGIFRKLLDAMMESRRRQAEAEIARHAGLFDRMTDEAERKMTQAMFGSGRPLL